MESGDNMELANRVINESKYYNNETPTNSPVKIVALPTASVGQEEMEYQITRSSSSDKIMKPIQQLFANQTTDTSVIGDET